MKFPFSKLARLTAPLIFLKALCLAADRPLPSIPATDWRLADSKTLPLAAVTNYGGDSAIESEFGVKKIELRTYQLGKQKESVVVESTGDVTSSYGLCTFYRNEGMTPVKDIQLAAGDSNQVLMARGANFLRFLRGRSSQLSDSDFDALL